MRQAEVQALFLQHFGEHFPQLRFRGIRRFPDRAHEPYDLALRISLGDSARELDLLIVALTDGFPQDVERMMQRMKEATPPYSEVQTLTALVAPFMDDAACTMCLSEGIGYFDLAGNAGLQSEGFYFSVQGRDNPYARKRQVDSPFKGKAERVARRLLLEPNRRWNMRALAEAAQVSLGMASMATSALAEMGVVNKGRNGLELFDPRAMLESWAQTYDLRRSAFRIYRSHVHINELEGRLIANHEQIAHRYALTLWAGAHRLLEEEHRASRMALYWLGAPEQLANRLRLSETAGSTYVFVFQPYDESLLWESRLTSRRLQVVHPVQLYLDLASGDDEELALAQRVREQALMW